MTEEATTKRCGTCFLWAPNFYERMPVSTRGRTCCADARMDLPASFIPSRQTMTAGQGADCICWTALEAPEAQS